MDLLNGRGPVLFVGHGSPMNAIGDNRARTGWRAMGEQLGRPKAIVALSAHWATRGRCVRTAADNPQINDMYGFPAALYEVRYEPAGDPVVAERVIEALAPDVKARNDWGIDHGAWSVLCNMYPAADVPVVMLSTDLAAAPDAHFDVGRRLAALREEGVMIVCSGNVVHNLRMVNWRMRDGFDWAQTFDDAVRERVLAGDYQPLVDFEELPDAHLAIPTTEHYLPLLTALGAATPDDEPTCFNDYCELGSMSMTSFLFR